MIDFIVGMFAIIGVVMTALFIVWAGWEIWSYNRDLTQQIAEIRDDLKDAKEARARSEQAFDNELIRLRRETKPFDWSTLREDMAGHVECAECLTPGVCVKTGCAAKHKERLAVVSGDGHG